LFKLAFRNIFRHAGRTALTLAAIVLGVLGLMLSGGFVEDVYLQLREATIHSHLGHLQIYRAGYYRLGRRDPYGYMIDDPETVSAVASAQEGVELVTQRLQFSGLLNNGRTDLPVVGEGVQPGKEAQLGTSLSVVAGRLLEDRDEFAIAVGEGVASGLGLELGDLVTVLANTPEGSLNSLQLELVGVFRSISKDYDARAIRIPLTAARQLIATDRVHSLVVLLTDSERTDSVAIELADALAGQDYEVMTWYQLATFYQKTVDLYGRQFLVLQIIILFLVLLGVINSVNITIYDRTGEFGTLMALGHRGRDVFELVVLENVLLGLLGAAMGVAIGIVLAWLISALGIPMPPPPGMNVGYTAQIRLVPEVILSAAAVAFLATVLGVLGPARRVTRLPVVDALRQN
jgi:putative ABC transport system permease protein